MNDVRDFVRSKLKGQVRITCRNKETGEVIVVENKNLVVDNAYKSLAELLGNVGGIVNPISTVVFGIGGAIPPDHADTGVTGAIVTLPVSVTYPAAYTVLFTTSWDTAASNVAAINEVGLFFLDNTLAARYTFAVMTKSVGWTWEIQWIFAYTVY